MLLEAIVAKPPFDLFKQSTASKALMNREELRRKTHKCNSNLTFTPMF